MDALFLKVLNLALTAGWLVLAVIAVRPLLRRAPKWITCALWAVVAVRLLCPVSIESALSLIPTAEPVPTTVLRDPTPATNNDAPITAPIITPAPDEPQTMTDTEPPPPSVVHVAAWVWLSGTAALLCWAAISYARLRAKMRTAVRQSGRVWQSERVESPFVLGFFRPRIYLPFTLTSEDAAYILAHEEAHIARRDHWIKPFAFLLLSIYWFHPLLWVAYALLCRDIELACDERVVKTMDTDHRCAYSTALLRHSVRRRTIAACPLAFGEVSVKERVKRVLHYKKPAFWIIAATVVVCLVVTVCFATNPPRSEAADGDTPVDNDIPVYDVDSDGDGIPDTTWEKLGTDQELTVLETAGNASGVSITITEVTYVEEVPRLLVLWKNGTEHDLLYGDGFELYRHKSDEWISCKKESDPIKTTTSIAHRLPAGEHLIIPYTLTDVDMSTPGVYRFETHCSLDDQNADGENIQLSVTFAYKITPQSADSLSTTTGETTVIEYDLDTDGDMIPDTTRTAVVPAVQEGTYRPVAVRFLPAHSSSTADYYLQTHADPFTVTAKEFAYGKTQIPDPVYKAVDVAFLVAEEFSGLLPRYPADAVERCCRVSNPNGSGTNFYLFSMGDRLMVGHYRMFGAANPTLSCEYLMELDTGGKSATAIIDELMNA